MRYHGKGVMRNYQNVFINVIEDTTNINIDDKNHPWRRCVTGKHFVKEHMLYNANKVSEHCAFNPSHKE
jgi:hypothetical protein